MTGGKHYPLSVTWPLLFTSLTWYGISWYIYDKYLRTTNTTLLFLSIMVFATATCSFLHWYDTGNSRFRVLDRLVVYATILTFVAAAHTDIVKYIPILLSMIGLYSLSRYYRNTSMIWLDFHILFHILGGVAQLQIARHVYLGSLTAI